ncbi:tetratricopeptide repeat protein [Deinococcus rubellus]|uniref:Tetratricopeptide repeat protein n=1 Tax=Deinococcus rubellus TaxID=1889240 RepID=A0ABY5YCV2_9DEIO|nr:tetratricopeptide repeat protein [Deinococcus rubellus]UWX62869.1 tetratricopeptide repeat protein [Deinococcus rubellus]
MPNRNWPDRSVTLALGKLTPEWAARPTLSGTAGTQPRKQVPLGAALLLALSLGWSAAQTAAPAPTVPPPAPVTTPATPTSAPVTAAPVKPRPPAANYVALGVLYYDQGNFSDAYLSFRAAAEADPMNSDALLGLGRSQSRLRLYVPSLDTLKKLVTQDPRNVSGYLALAQAYQAQYVGTSDRSTIPGTLDAALKVLDAAEVATRGGDSDKLDLNLSKIYNERGSLYRLQRQNIKAIDAFKQANTLNPDNGVILYNIGDMYYATGNIPEALNNLQLAVIADPSDPFNRAYYAKLLALSGNLSAARSEAAQAARFAPKNPYAVGQYGVVSYLAKDAKTARTQLVASIKLDPLRYPEFYYYMGRLELDQGNLKEARNNLTKAVALASTTPEYLYYLGLAYERSGVSAAPDRLRALDSYTRATTLDPGYQLALDGLKRLK